MAKKLIPFSVGALAVLSAAVFAVPAHADAVPTVPVDDVAETAQVAQEVFEALDSSADAQVTFESLPSGDQAAFTDYYLPVNEKVSVTVTPLDASSAAALDAGSVSPKYASTQAAQTAVAAAKGCYGGYVKRTAYSAVNIALYDIYTEGSWCSNGSSVTSASFSGRGRRLVLSGGVTTGRSARGLVW